MVKISKSAVYVQRSIVKHVIKVLPGIFMKYMCTDSFVLNFNMYYNTNNLRYIKLGFFFLLISAPYEE